MNTVYKLESEKFNEEYTLNNLDLFSRGLLNLIQFEFTSGTTFTPLAIARYSTENLKRIKESLDILVAFGFIKCE